MKPNDFIDSKMSTAFTTSGWTFWDIKAPTQEDIEASHIPIRTVSEAPEDDSEDVCIHCQLQALVEANENLAVELYEIKGTLEFLIKMLGGK